MQVTYNDMPKAMEMMLAKMEKMEKALQILMNGSNTSGQEYPIDDVQAAKVLGGVCVTTVRRKAASGDIPGYKKGGKYYFFESELINHIKKAPVSAGAKS